MDELHATSREYERVIRWWSGLDATTRQRELDEFAMEFAYHSAKVERATITRDEADEVYQAGSVTDYTGDVRSLFSVVDQRISFASLLEALAEKRPLDEEMVLSLHLSLTYGTFSPRQLADGERPGTYKLSDYFVRETHEVGAPVDEVAELTRDLCREVDEHLGDLSCERSVIVAAYLHNRLVTIHPFSEGTGRVARELMNYVLMRGGHPPVVIFEDEKPHYFATLETFDETGDLQPFKRLLRDATVRTWEERVRGC